MLLEDKARLAIDQKLEQSSWIISASLGIAVREFTTGTGEDAVGLRQRDFLPPHVILISQAIHHR